MADRSSATITIGGTLPRALLPDLLAAIDEDHLCVEYDGKRIEEEDIVSGEPLEGAAYEVRGGTFEAVEAFCREHKLAYLRRSDGCLGVWDAGIEIFTGTAEPRCFDVNSGAAVMLTLDEIRRLGSLEAIEAHCAGADFDPGPLVIAER